jgi:FkbM family methyltransferase
MDNFTHTPKHKDLIYDVGMHLGEDTEFYLNKGFRVVAFEADPEHANFCREKFSEFINTGHLKIVEGAIVDLQLIEAGTRKVSFYSNEENSVWGTVYDEWSERNEKLGASSKMIEVNVINFEEIIKEHGVPYYMKIDIEGCDMVCLNALKKIQERPDYISIESDKTGFSNIRSEIDLLNYLGYDGFQAIEQSKIPVLQIPPFPSREGKYIAQGLEPGSSGLFGAELNSDQWKSKSEILNLYRFIRFGYFLIGDDGIMNDWDFRGSLRLKSWAKRFVRRFTKAEVPGWYDTHARLSDATNSDTKPDRAIHLDSSNA